MALIFGANVIEELVILWFSRVCDGFSVGTIMDDGFESFNNDAWEDSVVDKIDVRDCEWDPVF